MFILYLCKCRDFIIFYNLCFNKNRSQPVFQAGREADPKALLWMGSQVEAERSVWGATWGTWDVVGPRWQSCRSHIGSHWKIFLNFYLLNFDCFGSLLRHGLSLIAASRGYSSLRCAGFSLWWLLFLKSTGSRHTNFSSCGTQGHCLWLAVSRAQAQMLLWGMWNLPRPGSNPRPLNQ